MSSRSLEVGLVAGVAIAAVGLISGVESSGREVGSYVSREHGGSSGEVDARSYRDMQVRAYGPNAALPEQWWRQFREHSAAGIQTPEDPSVALARRAARRAYQGAPPTIPHAVDQLAVPACLTCHERGVTLAGVSAPAMSHPRRDSCLQCHVVATDPRWRAP